MAGKIIKRTVDIEINLDHAAVGLELSGLYDARSFTEDETIKQVLKHLECYGVTITSVKLPKPTINYSNVGIAQIKEEMQKEGN